MRSHHRTHTHTLLHSAKMSGASDDTTLNIETLSLSPSSSSSASAQSHSASTATATSSISTVAAASTTLKPSERAIVDGCTNSLLTLLQQLSADADTPLPSAAVAITAARLNDYASLLSHAVTKFVLFNTQSESVEIMKGASEELANHLTGISCLLRAMLSDSTSSSDSSSSSSTNSSSSSSGSSGNSSGNSSSDNSSASIICGPTRRRAISSAARAVFSGVSNMLQQLRAHLLNKRVVALDATQTARVWAAIEKQLKQIPLTNATAVGREINAQMSVIRDATKEMETFRVEEFDSHDRTATAAAAAEEEVEDMLNDDDDECVLSASEYALIGPAKHLCALATNLAKSVYGYTLQAKVDESVRSNVEWLERTCILVAGIGKRIDDLISSLYAPQEREAVMSAVKALCADLLTVAEAIVQHNASTSAPWPVKAAAAATTEAALSASTAAVAVPQNLADCTLCSPTLTSAAALRDASDAQHQLRMQWLQRCVAQIHEGHTQAEKA